MALVPARLDSLRIKLFLAIAFTNALLVLVAYLVFSRSFDRGLGEYLNRAEEARLQPLITRLAEGYARSGDWSWLLQDRELWPELVMETVGAGRPWREGPPMDEVPPPRPRRGQQRLLTIDPRLMLFDADGHLLIGPGGLAREAVRKPITSGTELVGYLGYAPRLHRLAQLEKAFAERQGRRFALLGVGMLIAGTLLSAVLAQWLTRRIRALAQHTGALIQGEYSARIPVAGHDELAQLGQDFNRLAATLEAAQQARQQWIADIAHELRTPLAVLRAEIEALQDGIRPLGQPSLASLAQEVGQLTRLVEDLHLLSQSDLGALSYRKEQVVLAELIDDALQARGGLLQERGIEVEHVLDHGLRVFADPERIAQVLGNLLQNTARYTDAPGRLQLRLSRAGSDAELLWQDSSPGVAAEDLPRLTDRLFRVDASRARNSGGSGLGLAIARAIVDAHDGRMAASASPLGGLCWRITLPLAEGGVKPGHNA